MLKNTSIDSIGEEAGEWSRKDLEAALQKGAIFRISENLNALRKPGGKVYACPAAMAMHNFFRPDLANELDGVRGIVELLRRDVEGAPVIYM